ncbi:DUF418 domain-containing protein [Nocardia panacis]|uniref:DUF418 domain-containing protein n=1 Tax=Nocardia panacis TaxID=2340916 RepID=A0A3A4K7P4_9NOCA|nr:DUF418 domain-containing protein [Nocardia panacis]RJO69198.1 DUF418 domain-containing protein [Nocardia panacis]
MDQQVASVPRIEALDVLRGFSLGGIFVVNIMAMSGPFTFEGGAAHDLVGIFFHNKFYVLFGFLFGYSLTMQFRSAERAGANAVARTVRRCLALMAIGLLHRVFFYDSEVLFGYGAIALVLLALSRIRIRTALITAAVPFGLFAVVMTAMQLFGGDSASSESDRSTQLEAMRAGWLDAAAYRWDGFVHNLPQFLLFGLLNVLPTLLLGFVAGKRRILEQPQRYLPWLGRVQIIGYGIGLPIAALETLTDLPLAGPAYLAAPLLTAAYSATVLQLLHRYSWLREVFAPAGKLAATNYIGQSVLAAILFTGYGFAMAGRMNDWVILAIAAAVYAAQLAASAWYIRRHRYGPIEWVLRMATYGTLHPNRTQIPSTAGS